MSARIGVSGEQFFFTHAHVLALAPTSSHQLSIRKLHESVRYVNNERTEFVVLDA
jgi:hypothetical protein